MENVADEVQPMIEVNAGDSPSPSKTIARRRFVQSTLFPQKSPEKKDVQEGRGVDGVEYDEEECCGSQGRRKRKLTPVRKAAPRPRRAKKVAKNGNGKVASQEEMDESNSPGVASPETPKEKKRTSNRNRKTNVIQDNSKGSLPDNTTLSDHIPQPVPDLWLEAKKTAEEDSRRFAGRKLHPFFSLQKMGKKTQETDNPAAGHCFSIKEEKFFECGPIHVYETHKDDNITLIDWRNWAFHEKVYNNCNYYKQILSSTYHGPVESLRLDKILHSTNSLQELCLVPETVSHDEAANREIKSPSHDSTERCQLLEDHKVCVNSSCLVSDAELGNSASQECLQYSFNRTDQPQNSLWTYKYQPEKSVEVCGNAQSVKVINDWLCLWRERDLQKCKQRIKSEKFSPEEDRSYDSYCDLESMDAETGLKNVLLVMGPVGCGKSAAIYACAKEQGFEVIEVNSSDWRSGARIKQRFSEAVGLHWLKGSPENPKASQSVLKRKSPLTTLSRVSTADECDEDGIKLIVIQDVETTDDAVMTSQRSNCSNSNIRDTNEIKTLILFEEVDATLLEDRGFIATIQQLAQTAKRPMILTSNNSNPVLPESLEREEVYFSLPSQEELLQHVCMVCNVEKSDPDPYMIDKYIQYCQGDVRKSLMHIQFWCQGQQSKTDGNAHKIYSSLIFDLEAAHETLSKIIPWGFSSELSEHIEMEISKSCRIEEQVSEEIENSNDERLIEAKKQAILAENFTSDDNDLITRVANSTSGLSNSSGSPLAFNRRKTSRKLSALMFDSDDEVSNYEPQSSWRSGSVSCVPESTFLPETEVYDGTEHEVLSVFQNVSQPISILDELSEVTESQCNMNDECEIEDSQNGCEEFARGYEMLDECSRMDFRRLKKCNSNVKSNFVQEKWKQLQCADFTPRVSQEDKNASQAMKLASRMCNLVADADIMLRDCEILTTESFIEGVELVEDLFSFGWHDEQMKMTSAIAEHGYCMFAKNTVGLGYKIGLECKVNIAKEMLTSTNNSAALGKLLTHGGKTKQTSPQVTRNSSHRDMKSSVDEIVNSIVPTKCHLSLRGNTLKEYISTLGYMSKSEAHRASESPDNTRRRRKRATRSYLCLSPEEISAMAAGNVRRKEHR